MHLTLSRNPHPHPSLTLFAYMADCIRAALYKLPEPLRMFFHNYLSRAVQRLDRLFTLWQSGKLKTRIRTYSPGQAFLRDLKKKKSK